MPSPFYQRLFLHPPPQTPLIRSLRRSSFDTSVPFRILFYRFPTRLALTQVTHQTVLVGGEHQWLRRGPFSIQLSRPSSGQCALQGHLRRRLLAFCRRAPLRARLWRKMYKLRTIAKADKRVKPGVVEGTKIKGDDELI